MRKIILATWLVITIGFSGLLIYSIVYEIDLYDTIVNFKFQIYDVSIVKNSTGDIVSLIVSASIRNPSHFSSFDLNSIQVGVVLNEQESEYLYGPKWFLKTIQPRENTSVAWSYNIYPKDVDLFNKANTTGTWNWYFSISVRLDASIVGEGLFDRSQPFQGVRVITI